MLYVIGVKLLGLGPNRFTLIMRMKDLFHRRMNGGLDDVTKLSINHTPFGAFSLSHIGFLGSEMVDVTLTLEPKFDVKA